MDAKKVLAVLRQIEWCDRSEASPWSYCWICGGVKETESGEQAGHKEGCQLAALIAEAEHETGKMAWVDKAREANLELPEAQTGGWKPGTEPPAHQTTVAVEQVDAPGLVTVGYFGIDWKSYAGFKIYVRRWHELPPLPEQML